jgi:hypothetical protein
LCRYIGVYKAQELSFISWLAGLRPLKQKKAQLSLSPFLR